MSLKTTLSSFSLKARYLRGRQPTVCVLIALMSVNYGSLAYQPSSLPSDISSLKNAGMVTQVRTVSQIHESNQVIDNDEEVAFVQDNGNTDTAERSLLDKVQGMRQELQELRGQLEMQAHQLKALQQQQQSFYKDLDGRMRQSRQTAGSGPGSNRNVLQDDPATLSLQTSTSADQNSAHAVSGMSRNAGTHRIQSANEQIRYLAAYDLVKTKRFDEALDAMQAFIVQYPHGGYSANAEYWLGELYMVKNNYVKAIEHFETVLRKFPLSSKTAASSLKIGYALAASGKVEEAKMRLKDVLKNYPDTPTAQLATTKLDSLGIY